jgi:hypothetical protein
MNRCSWPTEGRDAIMECGKRAVVVYVLGGASYYRCRHHDTVNARAMAQEKGAERREITA